MKEEDLFPTPPDAPDPTLLQRLTGSIYFWWMTAFVLMGTAVIMISAQCSNDALQFPQEQLQDLEKLPFVDLDTELVRKPDGLWYGLSDGAAYNGLAVTFHESGGKKTRTRFKDGAPFGLIEQWDENGSLIGPRFKGEFSR